MAHIVKAPKQRRRRYTNPDLVIRAINRINNGEISLNKASQIYDIPRSTLWDKLNNRRPITGKNGPDSILSTAEEEMLAKWLIDMSTIGYPLTKDQLKDTVKRIIDDDGRSTPFKDNRPGRTWIELFFKRHPQLTMRIPENLGKERAVVGWQKIANWFAKLQSYLEDHELITIMSDPRRIFNADESGFPLSVTSSRVIAQLGAKNVYQVSNSTKAQITVLGCCNAAGVYIPPMLVFPGQRFVYNPLSGAPEGSFLGRSPNGWMDSEVFYEWLANHFYPTIRKENIPLPIILFVDGHATHLNIETCRFCRDNNILLYCFPSHCSHILQPLDLSVYSSLKCAWRKAVQEYQFENPGETVVKQTFARVFKNAWVMSATKKNASSGFRKAGLYPFDIEAVDRSKVEPSRVFTKEPGNPEEAEAPGTPGNAEEAETPSTSAQADAASILLEMSGLEPIQAESAPPASLPEASAVVPVPPIPTQPLPPQQQPSAVSSVFSNHLRYPKQVRKQSSSEKAYSEMPKALSGEQFIAYAEAKEKEKAAAEELKRKRKEEREARKKAKTSSGKQAKIDTNSCSKCKKKYVDDGGKTKWIGCDCGRWYHCTLRCCGIDGADEMTDDEIEQLDWECNHCS